MKRTILLGALASVLLLATATGASAKLKLFHSPTGNIACAMAKGGHSTSVRCDIGHHTWTAPPKPHSCMEDYGNGLEVGVHGKGEYTCAGDTILGLGHTLGYGHKKTLGRFKCTSRKSGMHCINRNNRHGFRLSSQAADLF